MLKSLYIATTAPRSGKSVVVLGIMELLSRRIGKLGFFRPIIRRTEIPDNDIELVRSRYGLPFSYESLYAMTDEEARVLVTAGNIEGLLERIFVRYKELERQCDFVACEGTDLSGMSAAFEFEVNARIASQIGAPLVIVTNGHEKSVGDMIGLVRLAQDMSEGEGCTILATVVNRVLPDQREEMARQLASSPELKNPVYVLPEEEDLGKPTVGEIAAALGISVSTAHNHVRNIFRKTGAENRTEAAVFAIRNGLVS